MPDIKHFTSDTALNPVARRFQRQGAASAVIQDVVTATGPNRSSPYADFLRSPLATPVRPPPSPERPPGGRTRPLPPPPGPRPAPTPLA